MTLPPQAAAKVRVKDKVRAGAMLSIRGRDLQVRKVSITLGGKKLGTAKVKDGKFCVSRRVPTSLSGKRVLRVLDRTGDVLVRATVEVLSVQEQKYGGTEEESRREAHLRDPRTPTVAYAIPNGMDPVTVQTALALAGFHSGHDRVGMTDCVRIECDESQRDRVRSVLEGVSMPASDGSLLPAVNVVFEDER